MHTKPKDPAQDKRKFRAESSTSIRHPAQNALPMHLQKRPPVTGTRPPQLIRPDQMANVKLAFNKREYGEPKKKSIPSENPTERMERLKKENPLLWESIYADDSWDLMPSPENGELGKMKVTPEMILQQAKEEAKQRAETALKHPGVKSGVVPILVEHVTFSLLSAKEFQLKVLPTVPKKLIEIVKQCEGSTYDKSLGCWRFPISSYQSLYSALGEFQNLGIRIAGIPPQVLARVSLSAHTEKEAHIEDEQDSKYLQKLPPLLAAALAPFQRKGVMFVHQKKGRALIADEMGLGKTIQAIASAVLYKDEWPCLVVCPAGAAFHWKQEFYTWLESEFLQPEDVALLQTSKNGLPEHAKIYILSYTLCGILGPQLEKKNFQVVIADECHYLKSPSATRTQNVLPILAKAKRAILLSGTPALSRPIELFTQLQALDPDSWQSLHDYGMRYCEGKKGRYGMDYSGASHIDELHTILSSSIMVRRLKKDILTQLPPKRRHLITVPVEDDDLRLELKTKLDIFSMSSSQCGMFASEAIQKRDGEMDESVFAVENSVAHIVYKSSSKYNQDGKTLLMQMFQQTGKAKVPAVVAHLTSLLDDILCGKILLFAHHKEVLDALEAHLKHKRVGYVRIDGNTRPKQRHSNVQAFQTDPACRVALLSIVAAGVAITLTAASRVIFAELYWTPALLFQAEDRCHRIGQTSVVNIEYLVAQNTLDDCLWPMIRKKMQLLGDLIEGDKTKDVELASEISQQANEIAIQELSNAGALHTMTEEKEMFVVF